MEEANGLVANVVGIYGIQNVGAFSERERHNIRTFFKRKQFLEGQQRNAGLGRSKQDELKALKWLFELLDELSEEVD